MNKFLLFVLLLSTGIKSYGQEVIIKGQVLSADDGKPVPGASVFVDKATIGVQTEAPGVIQNSAIGTVTDVSGNFTLKVPAGARNIRVSFLGFSSKLVDITGKSFVKVILENEDNQLKEVIVTGYSNIQKRKNTTASVKVNYSDIRQTGVSGIDQMLQGQIAGVAVTTLNGGPNAAPRIRIRGTASLQGTQDPLWVLDGIPLEGTDMPKLLDKDNVDELRANTIAGINPDDIESISILKDAAATAIYGARAANGVIVLTTKSGKKGAVQVGFSANTILGQKGDFSKLNLMNSNEKVDWELALAGRNDLDYRKEFGGVARILTKYNEWKNLQDHGFSSIGKTAQDEINTLRKTNTSWGDEIYQNTVNQQYTASLSGGTPQADYYFSAGYYNEKGAVIGTGLERYNLTLKTNFNVGDKLTLGAGFFGTSASRRNNLSEADAYSKPAYYSRNTNPYIGIKDDQGNYIYDPDVAGYSDNYVPFNILQERENTKYGLNNRSFKALLNAKWQVIPALSLRSELGLQLEQDNSEKFGDADSYYTRKYRERSKYYNSQTKKYAYILPDGGVIEDLNKSFFQYNWKNIIEYNRVFNAKHEIEALAGAEFRRNNVKDVTTRAFGFDSKNYTTKPLVFPANYSDVNNSIYQLYKQNKVEHAYASFYGTLSYTYDRRYTLYGSIRSDGSDLFGVDPKYRWLPIYSVSGAWNATEENFLKKASWLSNLKLRASYGIQGNIDKQTSPYITGIYENVTVLPGTNETGINVALPPNAKLRWEKTMNTNAGIDFGIFNNAIQLTADYYHRKSVDLIGTHALPQETGFSYVNVNWARMKNEGVELALSTRNIDSKRFSWSTDFNISRNKNKVLRQTAQDNQLTPSSEGYPVNSAFVIKTAGLDKQGYPQFLRDGNVVSLEDFYRLYDPWADFFPGEFVATSLSNSDFRNLFSYAGDKDPRYTGGFINRFRYSGFDLTVSASFNFDRTVVRQDAYNPALVDRGLNRNKDILNAWTPENTTSGLPRIIGYNTENGERWMAYTWLASVDPISSYRYYDMWAKNMSFVRINSIRLGYTLPASVSNRIRAKNLRVSLEGNNLFVLSKNYDGYFDPETYGDIYAQPLTKTINIGINASF